MGRGSDRQAQKHLGQAIRVLRRRAGLTQGALGKRADLHSTWICHIEAGEVNMTWGNLRRIAYGLEIGLEDLLALAHDYEVAEAIGIAVRAIRRQRGYTQAEIAKRAGLKTRFISRIERGGLPVADRKRLEGKLRRGLRIRRKGWNQAFDAAQAKVGIAPRLTEATPRSATRTK